VGGLVHERGVVGQPVPVRPPGLSRDLGAAHVRAWFVPVTVGERLAGFAVVDVSTPTPPTDTADRDEDPGGETDDVPDDDRADVRPPAARIRRWSTFQRHEGDLESCPEARLWTDPRTITSTAAAAVGVADAVGGEPVLTWERSPEHLVWEVTVGGRRVHVAGSSAWPA